MVAFLETRVICGGDLDSGCEEGLEVVAKENFVLGLKFVAVNGMVMKVTRFRIQNRYRVSSQSHP